VNHRISLFLDGADLVRGTSQAGVACDGALHEQLRRLANEVGLLLKILKELLFTRE